MARSADVTSGKTFCKEHKKGATEGTSSNRFKNGFSRALRDHMIVPSCSACALYFF